MSTASEDARVAVRLARLEDLQACRVVENDAGHLFAELGMTKVDDESPCSLEELRGALGAELLWVASDEDDVPVAFVTARSLRGSLYVRELAVAREHQRRGIGRMLLDAVARSAQRRGLPELTLSTFRDVPWNAPYYARLGFETLDGSSLPGELLAIEREERAAGLDVAARVFMRRPV